MKTVKYQIVRMMRMLIQVPSTRLKLPPAVLCSAHFAIGSLSMRLANLNSTPMQICTTLGALPEEVSSHMVVHPFLIMLQGICAPAQT